jgi:hypothetical protein
MQLLLLDLWRRRIGADFVDPAAFVDAVRVDPDVRAGVDRCLAGLFAAPDVVLGATPPVAFGHPDVDIDIDIDPVNDVGSGRAGGDRPSPGTGTD